MPRPALYAFAASALAIAWLGAFTDIDLVLARAMYDPAGATFRWRHAWWAETFSHVYMKRFLLALAGCAILAALRRWPRHLHLQLRVVALSAILVPLVTGLLKHASSSHCPWDLVEFGGGQSYVRLFEPVVANATPGRCMPAGHASSALWLLSIAVFWLPRHPRRAAAVAVSMLACGFGLGWIQQMRGAHFLSHTLWSVWIACATVGLVYGAVMRPSQARRSPSGRAAPVSLKSS